MAKLEWEVDSERKKVVRATAECPLGRFYYEPHERGYWGGLWFVPQHEGSHRTRIQGKTFTLELAQAKAEEYLANFDREWQAFYHGKAEEE